MQPICRLVLLCAALLSVCGSVAGQDDAPVSVEGHAVPEPLHIFLYVENDSVLKPFGDQDRHYTSGQVVGFSHVPDWAQPIAEVLPFAKEFGDATIGVGYFIGLQIYTPVNIQATAPQFNDWPYAGYLYGGGFLQRENNTAGKTGLEAVPTLDTLRFEMGVVGPNAQGETFQRFVHVDLNPAADDPNGWRKQIGNEIVFNFYLDKRWRFPLIEGSDWQGETSGFGWDVIPRIGTALGTVHRRLHFGGTTRFGWNLPNDFGPGRVEDPAAATGYLKPGWTFYGFGRVTGYVVEYNQFLDGNQFGNDIVTQNPEPFFAGGQLGAAVGYGGEGWTFDANWSFTFRSKQFKGQDDSIDSFGAVNLTFTMFF